MAKIVLNFVVSNSSALKKHLINYNIYLRKYSKDKNSLNIESNLEKISSDSWARVYVSRVPVF